MDNPISRVAFVTEKKNLKPKLEVYFSSTCGIFGKTNRLPEQTRSCQATPLENNEKSWTL